MNKVFYDPTDGSITLYTRDAYGYMVLGRVLDTGLSYTQASEQYGTITVEV